METSTFVKLEKTHNGTTISVTRPRVGELSNDEIQAELIDLDSVLEDSFAQLEARRLQHTAISPDVGPGEDATDEAEVEEKPKRTVRKKVGKKKAGKKVGKKKVSQRTGKQDLVQATIADITKQQIEEINTMAHNIVTNIICDDSIEAYEEMSDEDFNVEVVNYITEFLRGEELKSLNTEEAAEAIKTLGTDPNFNGEFFQDGQFVELE